MTTSNPQRVHAETIKDEITKADCYKEVAHVLAVLGRNELQVSDCVDNESAKSKFEDHSCPISDVATVLTALAKGELRVHDQLKNAASKCEFEEISFESSANEVGHPDRTSLVEWTIEVLLSHKNYSTTLMFQVEVSRHYEAIQVSSSALYHCSVFPRQFKGYGNLVSTIDELQPMFEEMIDEMFVDLDGLLKESAKLSDENYAAAVPDIGELMAPKPGMEFPELDSESTKTNKPK